MSALFLKICILQKKSRKYHLSLGICVPRDTICSWTERSKRVGNEFQSQSLNTPNQGFDSHPVLSWTPLGEPSKLNSTAMYYA